MIAIAGEINGRFTALQTDSSKLAVTLQINTLQGNDALGGATIVFDFDTTSIKLADNLIKDVDYLFYNFSGGLYSAATITEPVKGKVWVNIDLPFNNSNQGIVVSDTSDWTDVVTIFFNIKNVNGVSDFHWDVNSPFWGIYADDNFSSIEPNEFQDLLYLYDTTAPQLTRASLIDSVNLEIEFNEQVDSIAVLDISNYSIDNGVNILGITKTSNPNIFVLQTTSHLPGQKYKITVEDITDISGNIISADFNTAVYEFVPSDINDYGSPLDFSLQQNYPNPFNPSTRISWQLPVGCYQTLKVFDVLGNEVATLVDEFKPAGTYEIEFNSENLASGIYFYSLNTAEFTQTKKMILLR